MIPDLPVKQSKPLHLILVKGFSCHLLNYPKSGEASQGEKTPILPPDTGGKSH